MSCLKAKSNLMKTDVLRSVFEIKPLIERIYFLIFSNSEAFLYFLDLYPSDA